MEFTRHCWLVSQDADFRICTRSCSSVNWCSKMPPSGIMQSVTMFFFSPHQSLCKTLLIGELGLAARCHILVNLLSCSFVLKLRIYTDTVDLKWAGIPRCNLLPFFFSSHQSLCETWIGLGCKMPHSSKSVNVLLFSNSEFVGDTIGELAFQAATFWFVFTRVCARPCWLVEDWAGLQDAAFW